MIHFIKKLEKSEKGGGGGLSASFDLRPQQMK